MLALLLYCRRLYHIAPWKTVLLALVLTLTGAAGVKLMFFIEQGNFSGRSFFGAVFLVPPVLSLFALAVREKPAEILDICAPNGCLMLALLKIKCFQEGCCYGMVLRYGADGVPVRFPSQIVECICSLILMAVLVLMLRKGKYRGLIYPWYLYLYGISRFVLNLLRDVKPDVWIIPYGNLWSLICILIAVIWFAAAKKGRKNTQAAVKAGKER